MKMKMSKFENTNERIATACSLSNKLGYKLGIDFVDNKSWTVSMYNEDGPADELDGIVVESIDLDVALESFITEAKDEVDSNPDSLPNDNDEDDED